MLPFGPMTLSDTERDLLAATVGTMIPADAALGLPGANDPAILDDLARSLGRDLGPVRAGLATLAARGFAGLDRDGREALLNELARAGDAGMAAIGRVTVSAYYRDDRVLASIGMAPGAPFPRGYAVEPGDWSLLDAVRGRAPFWRDDRA